MQPGAALIDNASCAIARVCAEAKLLIPVYDSTCAQLDEMPANELVV
jgi:hypothetical protein